MPRRTDLKRVLIIGSGPIVIGQACEFDYSGSQACKALRAEGLEVILVNSNPATIMTDPELADRTYVEPLTPEVVAHIIERERPDALLPTVGGQTGLNLAVELEVMRDAADNFVVICSIENVDPMGVHTGDSITVAPILTLTDKEYQRMRDAARRIISRVGVETGGSNIQFAVNPKDGRMVVIEMNPRVSRSSALASKATGFPIAKIAAKLALGYHLDEIPNDITRLTPASFEPTIDYVVVKIPRWNFEKFPQADRTLTTQMKSVGEVMAIGRTFKEAFMKGVRSLELGRSGLLFTPADGDRGAGPPGIGEAESDGALRKRLGVPTDRRMWDVFRALDRGWTVEQVHESTKIDPWFLRQFAEIVDMRRAASNAGIDGMTPDVTRRLKRPG